MARKIKSDHFGMLCALGATAVFGWLAFRAKNTIRGSGTVQLAAGVPYRFTLQLPNLGGAVGGQQYAQTQALLAIGATDIKTNTIANTLSFTRVSPVDTSLTIGTSPFTTPALANVKLSSIERLDGKSF